MVGQVFQIFQKLLVFTSMPMVFFMLALFLYDTEYILNHDPNDKRVICIAAIAWLFVMIGWFANYWICLIMVLFYGASAIAIFVLSRIPHATTSTAESLEPYIDILAVMAFSTALLYMVSFFIYGQDVFDIKGIILYAIVLIFVAPVIVKSSRSLVLDHDPDNRYIIPAAVLAIIFTVEALISLLLSKFA